jgi:hypothetical protein
MSSLRPLPRNYKLISVTQPFPAILAKAGAFDNAKVDQFIDMPDRSAPRLMAFAGEIGIGNCDKPADTIGAVG